MGESPAAPGATSVVYLLFGTLPVVGTRVFWGAPAEVRHPAEEVV